MAVIKWDGVTDADLILKALLFFIDEEDEEKALKTSYGDFGKYLQMYRGSGAGNGEVSVESFKGNPRITLKKKNVSYQLTWNKAAKLIHQYLHGRNKNESI